MSTRSCNFDSNDNDVIFFFRSILIIVQASTSSKKNSDTYQHNQLKPFSADSSDPYVTAGFSYDNLPKTFVVGDGGTYTLDNTNYINQPLKANTPYILFVRFIETEVLFVFFISTMLCAFWLVVAPEILEDTEHVISTSDHVISTSYRVRWLALGFTMQQKSRKCFNINVIWGMWSGLCPSF